MSLFAHVIATEFSDDEAFGNIKEYVQLVAEQAKESGEENPALILAEKFSTATYIPFYLECEKQNVKPIFGLKVTIQGEQGLDHDLILIALNEDGRQNLNRITTDAYIVTPEKAYKKITRETLQKYRSGLACVSGGENGLIENFIINDEMDKAKSTANYLNKLFNNNFYLQVKRVNTTEEGQAREEKVIEGIKELNKELNIPLFASNDVRFAKKEYYRHHLTRKAIYDGEQIYDPSREIKETENQYLLTTNQMMFLFDDLKESVLNVGNLVDKIDFSDFKSKLDVSRLPNFPIPEGFDNDPSLYLRHVVEEGFKSVWNDVENSLKSRLGQNDKEGFLIDQDYVKNEYNKYRNRIDFELDVIEKTGFPGYFLIVHELVDWCKKNDIPVGPGRGSGAGSLVLYSLKITDINPIEFDLLFERFLNPERMSEPDIDIDFSPKNRDRVIQHMADLYGRENTAQILTYGTMATRSAIDNVGRVKGLLPYERDRIKGVISEGLGINLKDELENNEKLINMYNGSRQVKNIVNEAKILEGSLVSYGKHAGGVVISLGEMPQYAALYREEGTQIPVVQIDKDLCEKVGLIKFDILGLNNLDIIDECIKFINKDKQKIDITKISLDDEKAIELFQTANTYGVFQFESPSMRRLMNDLRPDSFEEVVALVALFRPGPLQSGMAEDFVKRKFDNSLIEYPHPRLKEILENTYGTIIYQEQVMSIARELAGFTLGQADILRKAMGKKIKEIMDQQREFFAAGAAEQFREQTLKRTAKKFVLASTGKAESLDIILSDIDLDFVKELVSESDGKIKNADQVVSILKEYAGISEDDEKKINTNINYIEEKEFFQNYFPLLRKNGIEKLKQQGLSNYESEKIISRLTVASGIYVRFNKIFSLMDKFAAYGFNKSHSVAYAKVSMQTAYLKAHYPSQYMASLLSNQSNIDSVTVALNECRKMNLNVLPPDINESNIKFEALSDFKEENKIRYGLGQIKGVKAVLEHFIKRREDVGKMVDIYDFYEKFGNYKVKETEVLNTGEEKVKEKTIITKTLFNNLLNAGAFDSLCPDNDSSYRTYLYTTFNNFKNYQDENKKHLTSNYNEISKKIKGLEHLVPDLEGTTLKDLLTKNLENVNEKYKKFEEIIIENSKVKSLKINYVKTFEEYLTENKFEFTKKEVNGLERVYVKPALSDYKVIPDKGTKERAYSEFSLTGFYQTAHPLYSEGLFNKLKKEEFNTYKIKDLPRVIEANGVGRKRKYFDLKIAGTVLDVKDFKKFNEDSGDFVTNITLLIDDGTGTATVRFKAEELFQSGKEQKAIDMLRSMMNKEVIKIEGASTKGAYESAGVTIYANRLGSGNSEIILPVEDKGLNQKPMATENDKPATPGQLNYVKSLMKNNKISDNQFFKDYQIDNMENLTQTIANDFIEKYKNKKLGYRNKP